MSTIAGIPLYGGSSSQFALLPDATQAFNTTGRYLDMTRSIPIVNELATNAERTALGVNQPTVLQSILGNLGSANIPSQYSSTLPSSVLQSYTGMSLEKAHSILGISNATPQQPSQAIASYPKIENTKNQDTKIEIYRRDRYDDDDDNNYNGPPGLRRFDGIPPGHRKHGHWKSEEHGDRHKHKHHHKHHRSHNRRDD